MNRKFVIFTTLLFCILSMQPAFSLEQHHIERTLWTKKPIPVGLVIGQERLIHFPVDVRYWIPASIENAISILAANGVLYVTAYTPFESTRIRVQALDTQKMYLLDLMTVEQGQVSEELIVVDEEHVSNQSKELKSFPSGDDWYVRLIRFASQSLYAPERLMPADSAIHPIRMNSTKPVMLVRGGDIEAIPVNSWRGGGFHITAVRLRNLSSEPLAIVHEASRVVRLFERTLILASDIRGEWLAAATQHTTLGPGGMHDDRTTLYLISEHPFMESF